MIKYPLGFKKEKIDENKKHVNYKNRGLSLESLINDANKYYEVNNIAFIYKKPTPIHIVKTDKENTIIKAYFEKPSTTDYNGLYKGKYIDFEAKETKSKTSFNLNNFQPKQITHLKNIDKSGGIAFIIIYFKEYDEYYLYLAKDMFNYLEKENKKSISYKEIKEKGKVIPLTLAPILDYLKIIDKLFF